MRATLSGESAQGDSSFVSAPLPARHRQTPVVDVGSGVSTNCFDRSGGDGWHSSGESSSRSGWSFAVGCPVFAMPFWKRNGAPGGCCLGTDSGSRGNGVHGSGGASLI